MPSHVDERGDWRGDWGSSADNRPDTTGTSGRDRASAIVAAVRAEMAAAEVKARQLRAA
jgi:hypothetical protein